MKNRTAINTGLDGFILIDHILHADRGCIDGEKTFRNANVSLGMEALAQLGAIHCRFCYDFDRHFFLLKIKQCEIYESLPLSGTYALKGKLMSHGESAFLYDLQAVKEKRTVIDGQFLIGSASYNDNFKEQLLRQHYRDIFSCLWKNSNQGC